MPIILIVIGSVAFTLGMLFGALLVAHASAKDAEKSRWTRR